jgi:predicted regulator of Ras-like GTPase activity (Roadblock/LC7/MglB family)
MAADLPSGLAAAVANDLAAARAQMHASLVTLKDVYGITGSFVFARSGHLVARELPPMFDDAALSEAGSRLTRLQETFASVGNKLEVAVLRYREHKVYVKTLPAGALCIISSGGVNMPALRMAASLVGRRIAPVLDQVADDPALARAAGRGEAPAGAPPAPAEASPRALAPPGMRRFRGRTLG